MRHSYDLPDMVIPSGETESQELDEESYGLASGFIFGSPDTLPETVVLQVSLDEGVSFQSLEDEGVNVELEAGEATAVDYQGWDVMRLQADGAVAADRTFTAQAQEHI